MSLLAIYFFVNTALSLFLSICWRTHNYTNLFIKFLYAVLSALGAFLFLREMGYVVKL